MVLEDIQERVKREIDMKNNYKKLAGYLLSMTFLFAVITLQWGFGSANQRLFSVLSNISRGASLSQRAADSETRYQITHLSVIEDRPEPLKPARNSLETHPFLTKINFPLPCDAFSFWRFCQNLQKNIFLRHFGKCVFVHFFDPSKFHPLLFSQEK